MKDLPYFLFLIKKNALLWTIITTNSFTNINLEGTVHGFWSSQCLELRDYLLNKDEQFKSIRITDDESQITIDFFTDSNKYTENVEYYFGKDAILKDGHYVASSSHKRLRKFDIGLELPVDVELVNYGADYGNVIGIIIYKKIEEGKP